jgi:hypothetical protein
MKPGSWPSPISASLLAVAGNRNKDVQVVGDDLWWDEMRPSESGRTLVVSQKHGDLIAAHESELKFFGEVLGFTPQM